MKRGQTPKPAGGRDGANADRWVRAEHMIPESPKVDRAVMAARESQRLKRDQS